MIIRQLIQTFAWAAADIVHLFTENKTWDFRIRKLSYFRFNWLGLKFLLLVLLLILIDSITSNQNVSVIMFKLFIVTEYELVFAVNS
jgi:hypothetical protein